ncbi:MAG: hypothetical protein RBT80_26380 [Candidatus Vecturithrix sp.]|jgi:hypothetical protein|nr:hypothetical protein [Candidatus Vecturithrix sp.]
MIQYAPQQHVQPEVQSVAQFCRVVQEYARQSHDPHLTARVCETQAERLRISRQEVSVETIDLLLDTLLNTLHHVAEGEGRKWGTLWGRFFAPAFLRKRSYPLQARKPPNLLLQK